jgi:hypothetical protein
MVVDCIIQYPQYIDSDFKLSRMLADFQVIYE